MNADHIFIADFLAGDRTARPISTNPLLQLLNAQLLEADAAGKAVLSFEPPETYIQGAGVLQGGALVMMLDFAMAFAALAALPLTKTGATASLNANLLKPAPPGKYVARATVERLGSQVAFVSAVLERASGQQVVANATCVMPLLQLKSP